MCKRFSTATGRQGLFRSFMVLRAKLCVAVAKVDRQLQPCGFPPSEKFLTILIATIRRNVYKFYEQFSTDWTLCAVWTARPAVIVGRLQLKGIGSCFCLVLLAIQLQASAPAWADVCDDLYAKGGDLRDRAIKLYNAGNYMAAKKMYQQAADEYSSVLAKRRCR